MKVYRDHCIFEQIRFTKDDISCANVLDLLDKVRTEYVIPTVGPNRDKDGETERRRWSLRTVTYHKS